MTYSVWGSFGANVPTRDVFATETFAALRLLTPPFSSLNVSIELDGGTTKGDGFGGIFYYDPNSVLADDNLNVIAPSTGVGRWRRVLVNFGIPAAVIGGILFGAAGNTIIQDSVNLFWDNTLKQLVVGDGSAANASRVRLNGGSNSSAGPIVQWQRNGLQNFYLGHESAVIGNNSNDATLYTSNQFKIYAGDALRITVGTTGAVIIPVSVVTPLVGTATAADFAIQINGVTRWIVDAAAQNFTPASDNNADIGSSAKRIGKVVTPIIDSGTAGSLLFRTGNGTIGLAVRNVASGINFLSAQAGAAGNPPIVSAIDSSETNVGIQLYTKGTGTFSIGSDVSGAAPIQFQILHTASANRNPTVTGSNGGNVQWGSTAGGSDFTSTTIRYPNIGTTAVAANATLNAVGSNDLLRSTSSQRYKKDWVDLEDTDLNILDTIRTIKYKSISEQDDPTQIHYGMLAEDVFKLNKNLITFNTIDVGFDLDVPDWVQYERFIPLLIEQRRRDVKRIEALEAKLGIH